MPRKAKTPAAKSKVDGPRRRQKADFACVIAEWLREQGYEVYCEVTYGGRSGRRIIGRKISITFMLPCPEGRRKGKAGGKNRFFQEVAKKFGIGVIRAKVGVFDPRAADPKRYFSGPRFALLAKDKEEQPHCLKKEFLHPAMAHNIEKKTHFAPVEFPSIYKGTKLPFSAIQFCEFFQNFLKKGKKIISSLLFMPFTHVQRAVPVQNTASVSFRSTSFIHSAWISQSCYISHCCRSAKLR